MSDDEKMAEWTRIRHHPTVAISVSVCMVSVIGVLDCFLPREIPLQLAYILPIAIIGAVSGKALTLASALLCTLVSEGTDAYAWDIRAGTVRDTLTFIAFAFVGLYVREFFLKQDMEGEHLDSLQRENAARVEAQEQLQLLIGNSALAILSLDPAGIVLHANHAAKRMFLAPEATQENLTGLCVSDVLPSLARVLERSAAGRNIRTMMQAQGKRLDGDLFLAEVWFSNYSTPAGRRVSVMVVDISEEFRNREESIAEQLINNSRLAVGAMAHEMRNLSSAVQLVTQSLLLEVPELAHNAQVLSLRDLLATLENMAAVQVSDVKRTGTRIYLHHFAAELHVVALAILAEHQVKLVWQAEPELPPVWANSEGLMQIFLNLLRNSTEALRDTANAEITISIKVQVERVEIIVADNGPGVARPDTLFHPFHSGGSGSGLGLYLSRAMIRGHRGDLHYVRPEQGAQFTLVLEVAR